MRAFAPAAALLLLVALAGTALAGECTTSEPEGESGGFYFDVDCHAPLAELCVVCFTPTVWVVGFAAGWCDFWVYSESNGIDGLQRQDEVRDDTDGGRCYDGDTIVF